MTKADVPEVALTPETFAKAGEVLKKLNDGESPDLAPCGEVARILKRIRDRENFERLEDSAREKLRIAAGTVNPRFSRNDSMLLNFLSEAFGATNRPHHAEPDRRGRIGTFLENIAAA